MSPTVATFVFELINVLLLVGLLSWLFFKPVRAALQAKLDAERQRRDDLAVQLSEVERQKADLDQRLRAFEAEMAQTRQAEKAAASQEGAAILALARHAAEGERESVIRALAQLERAQLERLSAAVAGVTRESVTRLLTMLGAPDIDMGLVHAACRQLAAYRGSTLGRVLVESAHQLRDTDRAEVIRALDGNAPAAEFRVVPELGAGLRIVTAKGFIDASALGLAREAERVLSDALTANFTRATV